MDLSVVIVNYNVRQFLENALASVYRALHGLTGEVFVVDNASEDGSVEMVRSKFPAVHLIENPANVGFARANNVALKKARGRYLLLLNPDTVVQEDTFTVMVRFLDAHPEAGLAGCKILNPDGSFQLPCRRSFPTPWVAFTKIFGLSALFPKSRLFGRYNLTYLDPDETYPVDAVSGSFMMLRREVYEKVGGLDEAFFMYGEDLDWCYRIQQAGYRVYYVPTTQIIHFKGESTKRSDIDEIRMFYQAMQLFVEKHFSSSLFVEVFLSIGITLRAALAMLRRMSQPVLIALVDCVLVDLVLIASEYLYFGHVFGYPSYAYPIVWTVPPLIVAGSMYFMGVYTTYRHSVSRSALAVIVSYLIVSATVFFAKNFAFSRAVVLIAGAITFVVLPGWRVMLQAVTGRRSGARRTLFGRPTVIVGTGPAAQEVLRRLRARVDNGYDVVGFVATHRRNIGEKIAGVEVVGSIDNVAKVLDERKVREVIFSTDGLSYQDILSVIARSNRSGVNFRLVPTSLEAIIGKPSIDELDTLPLVEIDYNIHKPGHRLAKRLFDLVVSGAGMLLYPVARVCARPGRSMWHAVLLLPQVFLGRISLVGRPLDDTDDANHLPAHSARRSYLGPRGITGLVQINRRDDLTQEEIERYKLYYAKNQSLMLDVEILLKALLRSAGR